MTFTKLYNEAITRLENAGIDDAKSDVNLLFYYLLGFDRSYLFMHANDEIDGEKVDIILGAISKREKRIPLQHITGKQEFMGLEFLVSGDVLVPRFDTENLVEEALIYANDGDKILDMCTGSGCIIISIMQYKNDIQGYASDISDAALEMAKRNAEKHDKNITFIKSNMFDEIDEKGFDIIVSNPPYIKTSVIDSLMDEVKEHDPYIALDGGDDGLMFYREIINKSRGHLKNFGYLIVEIGHDQGEDVSRLFEENGFNDVCVKKDLSGNDRVVIGRYVCLTS